MEKNRGETVKEIKFRACISPRTIIYFTLEDLVIPNPLFSIRELVKPWLLAGNTPDVYTGLHDKNGVGVYEGDIMKSATSLGIMRQVIHDEYTGGYRFNTGADITKAPNWEVVGNRCENPELLAEESRAS